VQVQSRKGQVVEGRICAIRKTEQAIRIAHERIRKNANKKGTSTNPETFEYAKYVIVFTNYPKPLFSATEILKWYRSRWQVELVFKRFKSIAQMGHLPKHSDDSSKAWLYGKLFVALLTMKLVQYASTFSPWGYSLEKCLPPEQLA
jgi:IS4 transposase